MTAVILARYDKDDGLLVFTALTGMQVAGSVSVARHGTGLISVGRLNVRTGFRGCGIARELMEYVLGFFDGAEAWLYAEPYIPEGEEPGAPKDALERFYASLGFETARKCPELDLMIRPPVRSRPRRSTSGTAARAYPRSGPGIPGTR